jgi:hypothetical protein
MWKFTMKPFAMSIAFSGILLSSFSVRSRCQTSDPQDQQTPATQKEQRTDENTRDVGVGIKLSSLGLGAEVGVAMTHRSNLRAGFNVLGFSHTFTKHGIAYQGHLNFKTFEAHYDFFPWAGSFHVSPGMLVYTADPIKANAFVPGNRDFTLGGVTFYSDPSSPTTARGKINFNRAAPIITVGWGNLISRKEGSRFSFPFEVGIAIQGSPNTSLEFTGNVCTSPGVNCTGAASDPAVQRNILSEQKKINNSLSLLRVYPIMSSGFAVTF